MPTRFRHDPSRTRRRGFDRAFRATQRWTTWAAAAFMHEWSRKEVHCGLLPTVPTGAAFHLADQARRLQGLTLDAAGLSPVRTPSEVVLEAPGLVLHGYRGRRGPGLDRPPVLIVPAPIKRAWIWDLAPDASVVRRLLDHGLRVYLVEWTSPVDAGLEAYAGRLVLDCLDAIRAATGQRGAVLAGHSLGGTLAAITAARYPDRVHALVLVESPLRFGADAGALAPLVA